MDPEVTRLMDEIRRAGPVMGRDLARQLGSRGAGAIEAVVPWLDDPAVARLAVLVIGSAGESGARSQARAALLTALERPISEGVRSDCEYHLSRLAEPSRPPESGIGKYMAPYEVWHHIIDEIVRPDHTHWYLSACRHWNTEGWITRKGKVLRTNVAHTERCALCDQAETRTETGDAPEWGFQRVSQASGTTHLYLRGDAAWHVAVEDNAFQTAGNETVYLTRCGWWIPSTQVRHGGSGVMLESLCENCGESPNPDPPETF